MPYTRLQDWIADLSYPQGFPPHGWQISKVCEGRWRWCLKELDIISRGSVLKEQNRTKNKRGFWIQLWHCRFQLRTSLLLILILSGLLAVFMFNGKYSLWICISFYLIGFKRYSLLWSFKYLHYALDKNLLHDIKYNAKNPEGTEMTEMEKLWVVVVDFLACKDASQIHKNF